MGLFYLVVLLLACCLSATVLGQVLAREDSTSFPEPLVFYNLTQDEFAAKLIEYRATSTGHQNFKRIAHGWEAENPADAQAVVEQLSRECAQAYGGGYRLAYGTCRGIRRDFYCNRYPDGNRQSRRHMSRMCFDTPTQPASCQEVPIVNFVGNRVRAPYCAEFIRVMDKTNDGGDVPTFEGSKEIPDKTWLPTKWDTFWQLAGHDANAQGSQGHFQYKGHFASGRTFQSQSPMKSNSWTCLGCPSGVLSVATVGYQAQAFGFTVPAGSWY